MMNQSAVGFRGGLNKNGILRRRHSCVLLADFRFTRGAQIAVTQSLNRTSVLPFDGTEVIVSN